MLSDSDQLLHAAREQAKAGRLGEAYALCLRAVQVNPAHGPALHAAGAMALQMRDLDAAEKWMSQAVAAAPSAAGYHNDLGIVHAVRGQAVRAEECYRKAVALQPNFATAHLNLGNALRDQGRWEEAAGAYEVAAEQNPQFPAAHQALATARREAGRVEDAIAGYRRALELRPQAPDVWNDLGVTLARARRTDEAIAALQSAIRLAPNYLKPLKNLAELLFAAGRMAEAEPVLTRLVALEPDAARPRYELGTALARLGRAGEGLAHLRRAIELAPDYAPAYCNAALALEDLADTGGAVAALAKARQLLPESKTIEYHLAALGGGEPPPICPEEYVVELFDSYADRFDQHLVERLNYRGPQLLFNAVTAAGTAARLDVIDLGCGTGLCGVLFRAVAGKLVGVDLSAKMIDKSRSRGVYDELIRSELVPALEARPTQFDVAVAGDVFIYVGDLRPVFAAVASALRPGGVFAFTLETIDAGDFVLRPSRRYAQSLDYVRRLADEFGFTEVSAEPTVIRSGEGPAVDGAVVVFRKT